MKVYINGIGNISAKPTWDNSGFLEQVVEYNQPMLQCLEPDFKQYISPVRLRRMSRIIKIGLSSAFIALKDAGIELPGSIITGTGFGCVRDTEKFLLALIDNDEQQLAPTAFMQSTHNTISGQIAINLGCKNYNSTYVHRGVCFERALLDGMMLINEGSAKNVLVEGFDECTENHFTVMGRLGHWKEGEVNNLKLLNYKTKGSIAGEGAISFVIDNHKNDKSYASIDAVSTFYKPESDEEVKLRIQKFLSENDLSAGDIDVIISGKNGDVEQDKVFDNVANDFFSGATQTWFKHLCGQFDASSAFGTWVASKILQTQSIPDVIRLNEVKRDLKKVLVFNHHHKSNYSLLLLSRC